MNFEKIGKFIAKERIKKNLSQEKLAEKLNVDRTTISKWETGKRIPDVSIILPLSECLNVSVVELLNGEKDLSTKEINTTAVNAIKYSVSNTKKKFIMILIIVVVCVSLLISVGFYLFNYNKLDESLISACQDDICIQGTILSNTHKSMIFIKNIEFNNEYVGTINDVYSNILNVSLISNGNVIIEINKTYEEKLSLSELLDGIYLYVDNTNAEYEYFDIKDLTLKIECEDESFIISL